MARKRGLSTEDKALWSRVAATAVPMHPDRKQPAPRVDPGAPPLPRAPEPPALNNVDFGDLRIGGRAGGNSTRIDLSPHPREAVQNQPLRMDHKTHRQMTRGKLSPEARIDLHGMTLAVAQPVLIRFILQAHADGRRLVLIITGKGKPGRDDGPIPQRTGVLRHQVPQWLRLPPLGAVVMQVTEAHLKHGGAGAYYVYLRRLR